MTDFYKTALDNAPLGAVVASTELDGPCLHVNPEFTRITGYSIEDIPTVSDWLERAYPDPEYRAQVLANWERDTAPGQMGRNVIYLVTCKDGSVKHVQLRAGAAGPSQMIVTLADVTARVATEQALRDSEERYRLLVESSPLGIVLHTGGQIDFANTTAAQIVGVERPEDLIGRSVLDFVHPEERANVTERMQEVFEQGIAVPLDQEQWVRADGSNIEIEVMGGPVRYCGHRAAQAVFTDVTERNRLRRNHRELERRMQQTQQAESLSLLAGGVAHDLNNLLVGIIGHADLARRCREHPGSVNHHLQAVVETAERAAELASQLLAYAGRRKLSLELLDLDDLVTSTLGLLDATVAKRATLHFETTGALPPVEADATQLRQILLNLVTNAADAGANTIEISTHETAGQLVLEVADDGPGMDEKVRNRVFDPFFTTKTTGRGLGLAAALGIARAHGGTISVDSQPGTGAVFRVVLPTASGTVERSHAAPESSALESWHGEGIALLVDDDPIVMEVGTAMLRQAGFEVEVARNGREALEILTREPERITCVLLDLTMPGWSGEHTFRRMREVREDLPIIVSSGFDENDATGCLRKLEPSTFLPKPYDFNRMLGALRQALGSPES